MHSRVRSSPTLSSSSSTWARCAETGRHPSRPRKSPRQRWQRWQNRRYPVHRRRQRWKAQARTLSMSNLVFCLSAVVRNLALHSTLQQWHVAWRCIAPSLVVRPSASVLYSHPCPAVFFLRQSPRTSPSPKPQSWMLLCSTPPQSETGCLLVRKLHS